MSELQIILGERNGDGRDRLRYVYGGKEFPDAIFMESADQREKSLRSAMRYHGIGTDNMTDLSAQLIELAAKAAQEKTERGETKERFPLVACPALDAEDYTARPLITGILYASVVAIIGGIFKVCKTLIAMDAAFSIATGRPFMGTFTVPQTVAVVYFAGEGGPSVTQEYGRRIAAAKGLNLSDVGNLYWSFSVPRLADLHDLDAMTKVLDDTAAEVVFIDNLMLSMPGDNVGNIMAMGQIFANLIRICGERGVTPVLVHHFKRTRATADPYAPGELLDLTQAGAAEIAGQWLLLTRREPFDPDQAGEHRLWLSAGGRVGHSSLHALDLHEGRLSDPGGRRWEIDVRPATEARQDADARQEEAKRQRAEERAAAVLDSDRQELVKVAARLKTPQTETDLRGNVSFQGQRFKRALASLADDGTLQPADVIKGNNRPYPAWKLREPEEKKEP